MIVLLDTQDGPVEGFESASWRHGISQVGSGQVTGDPNLVDVSGLVDCQVDGTRFRWRVEDEDRTEDDGSVKQWSGRGIAADFERAVVLPDGYPTFTQRERQVTGHPLAIWRTLALEAQARGRLPWLTIGFTGTQDSNGDPWTETVDAELDPGVDLLSLLDSMTEIEGAEWIVDPDGTLRVAPQLGDDRSNEVVLFIGRDQLSQSTRKSTRDVRRTVYLEASTGVSEATSSADPEAGEIWLEGQDWSEASTRSSVAAKLAEQLGSGKVQVDVTVSSDCGLYELFQVGDVVGLDDGESVSQVRVVAASVSQDDQPDVELTLVDQVELRRKTVEKAIEAKADVKLAASVSLQRRHGLVRADRIETGSLQADAEIRSTDYVPGEQGWRISGDGDVEFDRGTFRGDLEAAKGTFDGELVAASGTFEGELVAAEGTFKGELDAATGSFSGEITAGSGSIGGWTINENSLSGPGKISGGEIEGSSLEGVTITGGQLNTSGNLVQIEESTITLQTASGNPGRIQFSGGGEIVSFSNGQIRVDGSLVRIGSVGSGLLVQSSSTTADQRLITSANEFSFLNTANTSQRAGFRVGDSGSSGGIEIQSRRTNTSGVVSTSSFRGLAAAFFRTGSSRDYKENIVASSAGGLEAVLKLRPCEFDLKEEDPDRPATHLRGFVAEELPDSVRMDDGYSIDALLSLVVEAVQELACQVQELTSGC